MKKYIALVLAAVLVLGIFTGCGNKGNKETESQTDEKATESVNSAENNTEDSTQSSTENQNVADTEQLTTENGQESSVLACPSVNGKLHVEGSKLVDQNNNEVQLRGVSTHGLAWYPQYVTNDCFATLKSFGANVVRLAMYTYESGGYCTDGDRQQLETLVQNGVQYALNNDMYVIIDWHVLNEGNPNRYSDVAKTFFAKMAQQYASYNNVIYEICNEPCKGATWGDVKFYASEVIPSIRSYDKDAVILIGTPNWSQDVDEAVKDPVTGYDNIMYTLHFYAATHKEDLQNKLKSAADAGLPIFVSEFGICSADGNGQVDIDSANSWISLLDSYGISYVCWNLSNKDEKSALLTPACDKTSGFTYEDLSDEGKWLYGVTKSLRCTENGVPGNAGIEASMHSAGMHMRQMQILLSGGKSAADMALGLVDIENVTRFCGKLRVNAKQPVSIRDILVHSGFADAKLLCSLTHRGIVFNYVVGDFHRPCLNI